MESESYSGMKSLKTKFCLLSILFVLILGAGCGGRKGTPGFYVNPDIDFSFIKRVAVLPLDNLTNEKFAADAVRQVVISELLAAGLVDVTCPGDAIAAMDKLRLKQGQSPSAEDIKAIGKALKVQAVILKNGERLDTDFVIVGIGVRPIADFLKGVALNPDGSVTVDKNFRIAEDIYAAGDIARFRPAVEQSAPSRSAGHWV